MSGGQRTLHIVDLLLSIVYTGNRRDCASDTLLRRLVSVRMQWPGFGLRFSQITFSSRAMQACGLAIETDTRNAEYPKKNIMNIDPGQYRWEG